jgi:hypothetical protein
MDEQPPPLAKKLERAGYLQIKLNIKLNPMVTLTVYEGTLASEKSKRFAMKIPATVLMTFLFAVAGNAYGQAPIQPTLPQATVSLTLPTQGSSTCPTLTTGSNCIRNVPSGDATSFQNAIKAATCGDTIVLVAGSTYSGNFTIPSTSCSGWIEVQSSALGSLPSPGNRVGPSNATNMPVISTPNVSPAIAFLPGSNHWRFMGVEITTSYSNSNYTLYWLVGMGFQSDNSTAVTVQSQLPNQIIFDRCYIYGSTVTPIQHGLNANTQAFALVDSYCDEIVDNGADSQCVTAYNGSGPFLIQNNFLQALGENILWGGADPAIASLVPSDITIIGNVFQKNVAWQGVFTGAKNLLELKNAQRVLVDGNVFQYDWVAAQPYAVLIRAVNQSGGCMWCIVQDVTFTHNLVQHVPGAIQIAYSESVGNTTNATQRVLLQNNLILDSNSATWGEGNLFAANTATSPQAHDWIIDHNTGFSDHDFLNMGDSGTVQNFQLTNNIGAYGAYGIIGSGYASGSASLNAYAPSAVYNDILLQTTNGSNPGGYPPGTSFNTLATTGFTSVAGTSPNLTGNFQLLNTSPFYRAGTDGKDVGVWDWTCLNAETEATLAGNFVLNPECVPPQPPTDLNATVQ